MKSLKQITLIIFTVAIFATCKKEQLQPSTTVNQPVFSFAGSINSHTVNWQAGVDNYYMNSNYYQDVNNVYNFMGTLQPTTTSQNSIQIIINDYKVSVKNASAVIDSSLVPAFYSLEKPGGTVTSYAVSFIPVLNNTPTSYLWNFGDGVTSTAANPTHVYKHPSDYHTSLLVVMPSCGNEADSNIFKMGSPDAENFVSLVTVTKDSLGNGKKMDFAAVYSGTSTHFVWNFGDGTSDTITNNVKAKHEYLIAGAYLVTLTVTDVNNNISVFNENIVTSGYSDTCVVNYTTLISPITDSFALSNVTINYTDGAGILYTSNNALQPSTSSFKVLSVSSYEPNLNGQTTKMLKVQFSCLLYNGINAIPASGTATIAVAYK